MVLFVKLLFISITDIISNCTRSILAIVEFLYGSYQKSKEMGTTWAEEMREEFRFAMICYGTTKVIT